MLSRLSRGSKQAEAEQQHLGGLVAVPMQVGWRCTEPQCLPGQPGCSCAATFCVGIREVLCCEER